MTTKPVITLTGIKHTAWASEETHCYQATLYVDGEKWGQVGNDGHGGCDYFHGTGKTYEDLRRLNERIAATFEPYTGFGTSLEYNLEMICGDLVNKWLADREFAKLLRSWISDD